MAIIDMPLSQLKEYKGLSKLPDDFDSFWNSELENLKDIKVNVELIESDFKSPYAKCYDLYFTGTGGSRIYAKFLLPKYFEGRLPAIIEFHGYQGKSADWATYLKYVANGMCVVAMDCRGQAGKSEDRGVYKGITVKGHIVRGLVEGKEKLLYRDIFLDTALLAQIVMEMNFIDESRVATTGGSQGGALSLVCAALEPRIKSVFTIYPFLSDFRRVLDLDLGGEAYDELKRYFKFIDPTHDTEEYIFDILSYIDVQNFAHRIKADITMATGLMDVICPPSTQFAIYNKLECNKDMIIYPEYGHEAINCGLEDKMYSWSLKI